MARILWHGIGPWHKTAYGQLTGIFAPLIRDLGHEVVIAVMGVKGDPKRDPMLHKDAAETKATGLWQGIRVIGPGLTEFGLPTPIEVRKAFHGADPDLIIVLKDAWVLGRTAYERYPGRVAVWANIDCDPIGAEDRGFFELSGAIPLTPSLHGLSAMRKAGLGQARYIPHGIDTEFWDIGDQAAARGLLGLPERAFIAGIDAANQGPRKGWGEQLSAFAGFRERERRDALLLIHSVPECPPGVDPKDFEGINLRDLIRHLGITDAVRFPSHYNMSREDMRSWYQSLDVLMAASYGEGYGMPIVQALACGVPVIGTDCSAISEKILPGCGWLVAGQKWWNPHHQAWWTIPRVPVIAAKLGLAAAKPAVIRESAMRYDAPMIAREYFKPLIEELCA